MLRFSGTDGNSSPFGSPAEPGLQPYQGKMKQGRGGAGPVWMLGSDEANPPAGQRALPGITAAQQRISAPKTRVCSQRKSSAWPWCSCHWLLLLP